METLCNYLLLFVGGEFIVEARCLVDCINYTPDSAINSIHTHIMNTHEINYMGATSVCYKDGPASFEVNGIPSSLSSTGFA